jgi:hypothetical protein
MDAILFESDADSRPVMGSILGCMDNEARRDFCPKPEAALSVFCQLHAKQRAGNVQPLHFLLAHPMSH